MAGDMIISTSPQIQEFTQPMIGAARTGIESQSNIMNAVTVITIPKGKSGQLELFVGPVTASQMAFNAGFGELQTFATYSIGVTPGKFGVAMALSEDAEQESREDLKVLSTMLCANAMSREPEKQMSDAGAGFTNTVGDFANGLNIRQLRNEITAIGEIYDEKWITGPPDPGERCQGFMSQDAINLLDELSVGGGGTTAVVNQMWGGEPLPDGPAADVYRAMFRFSMPKDNTNIRRAPYLEVYPVDSTGAVVAFNSATAGGTNGFLIYKDSLVWVKRAQMETRIREMDWQTATVIQMYAWGSSNIVLDDRGATTKSKGEKPRRRKTS